MLTPTVTVSRTVLTLIQQTLTTESILTPMVTVFLTHMTQISLNQVRAQATAEPTVVASLKPVDRPNKDKDKAKARDKAKAKAMAKPKAQAQDQGHG